MRSRIGGVQPVSAALQHLVARGALKSDPLQAGVALALDDIAVALGRRNGGRLSGFKAAKSIKGAYLVGAVGRGKTLLMDVFFDSVPIAEKRRVHFHEFMDEMHEGIAKFRATPRAGAANADPVAAVAKPLLKTVRLLCLDEFQVTDITNAMLVGRLFERLFAAGVVLVATSNVPPDGLYQHGLNRELFIPFIGLLKTHCTVLPLDGPVDYRVEKFAGVPMFQFGAGADMEALWLRLTGGQRGAPAALASMGRHIKVPLAAMGAARFTFAELCEAPLGARDYLRLAHAYDRVMIENVPQLGAGRPDAARRFILLVDTLYDRGVKLAASFAVPLEHLAPDGKTKTEFSRALSRLTEMQSRAYLEAPNKAAPIATMA